MKKLETEERHGVMWKPPLNPIDTPKPNPSTMTEHGVDLTIPAERISVFGLPQDTISRTQSESNISSWWTAFRNMAAEAAQAEQRKRRTP